MTPLLYRQHVPNYSERSLAASGMPGGVVDRASDKFRKLVPNYNPDIIFKDEEGTGADRLMTQRCKEKLNTLAISVMNQWPGVLLRVTESWDEDFHHADASLHYEGRAVDITTSDRDRKKYGLLARLAVEAGFDWVYYESRTHVHASCKSEADRPSRSGGCFEGSSSVMLSDGSRRQMSELKVGDSVLSVDSRGNYEFSPVILFLDRAPEETRQFYVIKTASGHTLTLTPSHLIYAKIVANALDEDEDEADEEAASSSTTADFESVYAGDVREGDYLLVKSVSGLVPSRVVSIETVVKQGVYAPLTAQGNVVVDDVLASCYAQIDSQDTAHWAFAPVRLLWSLNLMPTPETEANSVDVPLHHPGIHWFADRLYSIAEVVMPNRLWDSRKP